MTDAYALTHKLTFVKKGMENTIFADNKLGPNKSATFSDPSKGISVLGSIDKAKTGRNTLSSSSMPSKGVSPDVPMCAYCKKKSHLMCHNVGF